MTKVSFATHPYLDQSKLPDNIESIPYRSVETLKEANQLHKMVEYFHGIASKERFYVICPREIEFQESKDHGSV